MVLVETVLVSAVLMLKSSTRNYSRKTIGCYTASAMSQPSSPALNFDLETVREVAALLRDSELAEICVETTSEDATPARLFLRRAMSTPAPVAPTLAPPADSAPLAKSVDAEPGEDASTHASPMTEVTSPAVGVFRPAKTPVEAGDEVAAGQVLGMVESLRVPNEIVSPVAGKTLELGAQDGQGVEYGQVLFVIEEAS
jgi:biotin carboxyl carrier protein